MVNNGAWPSGFMEKAFMILKNDLNTRNYE